MMAYNGGPVGRQVSILARKYNGKPHHERVAAELLFESPQFYICSSYHSDFIHHTVGKRWQDERATVYLLAKDQYYSIYWESPKGANHFDVDLVYCHVATPTVKSEGRLEYIDLDLDVIMWNDGHYVLDDADEFIENAQRWSYPDNVVQKAQVAATWLVQQAQERKPPFGFQRLEEVLAYYTGKNVLTQA